MQDLKEQNEDQSPELSDGNEDKFIVYQLGGECYGTRLTEVREVVELPPTKKVPNTVQSFIGVCNLRGQIIGVVDLRQRFDLPQDQEQRPIILVTETESGSIACVVDKIVSVSMITPDQIETKPNIVAAIPTKYIYGIGKLGEDLVTIINLQTILTAEELSSVADSKILKKAS